MNRSPIIETRAPDVARFVARRSNDWRQLAELVTRLDVHGPRALRIREARALGRLYRATCADLLVARAELVDAELADYLDALVARAYGFVYQQQRAPAGRLLHFLWVEFPRLVRAERRLVALACAFLLVGAGLGALVMTVDPEALSVVVPDMHLDRTPSERVRHEGLSGEHDAGRSAVFSSFLFTHNIQVTFLVFALGISFGIGSAFVLFWNGIPLGALAAQYHANGQGLFFWAWILPHGVVELSVVLFAGAAGFVLARGLWLPGLQSRRAALVSEARRAVALVLGGMPLLIVAGLVEGTISQMHAPVMPYWAKLCFAAALFAALLAYLLRRPGATPAGGSPGGGDD
jgi:uncharacterized membrane protein SpoIIM required for sporulation